MVETDIPTVIRTFKYKLRPTREQYEALDRICADQRTLYNAALEERIDCYRKTGKSLSYVSQSACLTDIRKDPDLSGLPVALQRETLKRLDRAFQAFFARVKKGQTPGFPRFKGPIGWDSFGFSQFSGITLRDRRLRLKGLPGSLRVHMHRPLPDGKKLSCQFRREPKGWHICIQVRVAANPLPSTGKVVGIDMGLRHLAIPSEGEPIPHLRITKRHEKELRRRQRHTARCKRGSKGRDSARKKVAKLHLKIRNTRQTYLHQISAKLVCQYDIIAVENLNVKNMVKGNLAKSIHDASWSTLANMLFFKAESAGRIVIKVDPRNTSQLCSGCGTIVPKDRGTYWHDCPECGLSMDRDKNAALNILARSGAMSSQDRALAHV